MLGTLLRYAFLSKVCLRDKDTAEKYEQNASSGRRVLIVELSQSICLVVVVVDASLSAFWNGAEVLLLVLVDYYYYYLPEVVIIISH